MIWIYEENLQNKLKEKKRSLYILFGADLYLLTNVKNKILKHIQKSNLKKYTNINLNINSNWENIFTPFKTLDLFEEKKIFLLNINKFHKNHTNIFFEKKIPTLLSLTKNNITLIVCINESIKVLKIYNNFKNFEKKILFVNCDSQKKIKLTTWINNQAKNMNLIVDKQACNLLCFYYENNFFLLQQILKHTLLIFSDKKLTVSRIKNIITDASHFTIHHWIEAIFIGNKNHADRILNQLKILEIDLVLFFQKIKQIMLDLINIKYFTMYKPYFSLLKKGKQNYYNKNFLFQVTKKLTFKQIYHAISFLVQTELEYKNNYSNLYWKNFETLSTILCKNEENKFVKNNNK